MVQTLIWVIAFLVIVVIVFYVVDLLLKRDKKAPAKASAPEKKEAPKPAVQEKSVENKTPEFKNLTIYNNDLADDLDAMLKKNDVVQETRLKVGQHVQQRNRIAQYVADKNYTTFDYNIIGMDDEPNDDNQNKITAEDYQRIVTLSNITDKK